MEQYAGDTLSEQLINATKSRDEEAVRYLLGAGADANTMAMDGEPLLVYAAAYCKPTMVAAFLDAGAVPDFIGEAKDTPFSGAIAFGKFENAEVLLKAGAKIDFQPDGVLSKTPLFYAVVSDFTAQETARTLFLLERGADTSREMTFTGLPRGTVMDYLRTVDGSHAEAAKEVLNAIDKFAADKVAQAEAVARGRAQLQDRARADRSRFRL